MSNEQATAISLLGSFAICWRMRKVDGWQKLATAPIEQPIELAA